MKRFAFIAAFALSLCAMAQAVLPDGYLSGGGSGGGGKWILRYSCNFNTAPLALLPNTDGGTFTVCGQTGNRVAVNFSKGGDAIDGGLILQCGTTGGSGLPSVCDGVYFSLKALVPGLSGQVPLRVCAYSNNPTTVGTLTGQFESLAVDNFPLSTQTGVVEATSTLFRSFSAWTTQDEPSGTTTTFNDGTAPAGMNVGCIYFPNGVGLSIHEFYVSVFDGGLPPLGGDTPLNWQGQQASSAVAYSQGPNANYNVFLSCVGNGTGTTTANYGFLTIESKL